MKTVEITVRVEYPDHCSNATIENDIKRLDASLFEDIVYEETILARKVTVIFF